jgi:glyceraldehyde-3-phosphate dehydrogenase/erythrose-4-phosphate dehydrogenase
METIEEAAEKYVNINYPNYIQPLEKAEAKEDFIAGAKWQAEQSQEAINKLISIIEWYDDESDVRPDAETFMWFEQFKKK